MGKDRLLSAVCFLPLQFVFFFVQVCWWAWASGKSCKIFASSNLEHGPMAQNI